MAALAVIGTGPVGTALGRGFAAHGHHVVFGVRDPADPQHRGLDQVARPSDAAAGAAVVVLAVPATAVTDVIPQRGFVAGQVLVDATNAVGRAVPEGVQPGGRARLRRGTSRRARALRAVGSAVRVHGGSVMTDRTD